MKYLTCISLNTLTLMHCKLQQSIQIYKWMMMTSKIN